MTFPKESQLPQKCFRKESFVRVAKQKRERQGEKKGGHPSPDHDDASSLLPPSKRARKTSKFRGVSRADGKGQSKKWVVTVHVDGKPQNLGYFDDDVAAARAYDVVAQKLHKPLNFPDVAASTSTAASSSSSSSSSSSFSAASSSVSSSSASMTATAGAAHTADPSHLKQDDGEETAAKSSFKGVTRTANGKKWQARIRLVSFTNMFMLYCMTEYSIWFNAIINDFILAEQGRCKRSREDKDKKNSGTCVYLGAFFDEQAAARAYDDEILARSLDRSLNFPPHKEEGAEDAALRKKTASDRSELRKKTASDRSERAAAAEAARQRDHSSNFDLKVASERGGQRGTIVSLRGRGIVSVRIDDTNEVVRNSFYVMTEYFTIIMCDNLISIYFYPLFRSVFISRIFAHRSRTRKALLLMVCDGNTALSALRRASVLALNRRPTRHCQRQTPRSRVKLV